MKGTHVHNLLLVDEQPMMRLGLRQLVEQKVGFRVVGEACPGMQACALAMRLAPDLIVLGNDPPHHPGLETLGKLRDQAFAGKILLFSGSASGHDVRDAMRLGADGILLKDQEPEQLIARIHELLRGKPVIAPSLLVLLAEALRRPPGSPARLTRRERQVLEIVSEGLSNKMVGNRLGITEGTVKVHMKNLMHKLGLRSRVEAALWAREHPP